MKDVNEMIVQASSDTSACYGVAKCAKIAFERVKMVKGEGQQVLHENEIHKFLGVEQADGIKTKEVYNRVKEEVSRRMKIITVREISTRSNLS